MDALGWDSCDIIIVTGDAYVDHPSFGMAIIGRLLEAQGFRVGIIAQPDWSNKKRLHDARETKFVLRDHRGQYGLNDQPLHR
ncbi:probable Fe-S oxidoreductase family 2 [Vibrio variabilis]|uniref:Probable Fe-S oxidoreductase family 2 n=1 Tax=Vibrio variabilis TaxID=990271 RepID=A0ABQ0JA34_9VIBR|nr:probable Fe-S oxidoreductase family 2 [Vibrio variabilis]